MSSKRGNIQYFRLKKYERFKDLELEDLKKVYEKVERGELDLKYEPMVESRKGNVSNKVSIQEHVENPKYDTRIVKELGVKRFLVEAMKDMRIKGLIMANGKDIGWIREIYSTSNLSVKDTAYLLDMSEGSLKYYLKSYGITKIPSQATKKLNNVEALFKFLQNPVEDMAKPILGETEEEFRQRYAKELGSLFNKVKQYSKNPTKFRDELEATNLAIKTMKECMLMEMEGKKFLRALDNKKVELKEKEIDKGMPKENTVINFNGDMVAQTLFLTLKENLKDVFKLNDEELDEVFLKSMEVTNADI